MDLGFEGLFASSWSRSEDHHVFVNQQSSRVLVKQINVGLEMRVVHRSRRILAGLASRVGTCTPPRRISTDLI